MKTRGRKYPGMACLAGVLLLPLAAPAQTDNLRLELGKCAAIGNIKTRVACYDLLARPEQAKPQAKAPEAARIEAYGKPAVRLESEDGHEEALLAKVTSLREVQADKLQITLANGQIWQQTIGKAFFIRTNDTVRIVGSGWGRSFRLSVDGHPGYIQVSRLQ